MTAALKKIDESIEALKKKLEEAKARKQKMEALARVKASKESRAADTRKKILIGAMVLESMSSNEETRVRVLERLDKFLSRTDDRALFGLPSRADENPVPPESL